jgi:hypothetical protein
MAKNNSIRYVSNIDNNSIPKINKIANIKKS